MGYLQILVPFMLHCRYGSLITSNGMPLRMQGSLTNTDDIYRFSLFILIIYCVKKYYAPSEIDGCRLVPLAGTTWWPAS